MPAVLLVSKEEQRVRARESDIQEVTGKKMTEKDTKIKINRMGGKKMASRWNSIKTSAAEPDGMVVFAA